MHYIHKQHDAFQFVFQCLVVLKANVEIENAFVFHFLIIIDCDKNWKHDIFIVVALDMYSKLYCNFVVTWLVGGSCWLSLAHIRR